jgi:hypothetical protein
MGIRVSANTRPWDGTRTVIKPTDYLFEIVDVVPGLTGDSLEKSVVSLKLLSDARGGKTKFDGTIIQGNYPHDGNGVGRTLQLVLALGGTLPSEEEEEFEFDFRAHIGAVILAAVENNKDKNSDKIYNNVLNERPRPAPAAQTANAADLEKLKGKKAS